MPPIAHVALLHMHIGIMCCWKGIAGLELDMVRHCSLTSDFDVGYLEMGGWFNFVVSVKLMHAQAWRFNPRATLTYYARKWNVIRDEKSRNTREGYT